MNSAFGLTEPLHLPTSQPLHSLVDSLGTHPLVHWIETDVTTDRLWRRWQHLCLAEVDPSESLESKTTPACLVIAINRQEG